MYNPKSRKIITLIIFILVVLAIVNGEYLRPKYNDCKILNLVFGALPNFIGSYILCIIFFDFLNKKILKNFMSFKSLKFISVVFVFIFLTFEEYYPFFTGSKTFDVLDIFANGIGVVFASFTINSLLKKEI